MLLFGFITFRKAKEILQSMLAWLIRALRGSDKMILLLSPHTYTSPVVKLINLSRVCDEVGAWDSLIWENIYLERMDQAVF